MIVKRIDGTYVNTDMNILNEDLLEGSSTHGRTRHDILEVSDPVEKITFYNDAVLLNDCEVCKRPVISIEELVMLTINHKVYNDGCFFGWHHMRSIYHFRCWEERSDIVATNTGRSSTAVKEGKKQ